MKRLTKPDFHIVTLFLAIFIIIGCSTNGIQRSGNARTSLETVEQDIEKIITQLDRIGVSLNKLTKHGQENLREVYDQYSENISHIDKLENDFQKHMEEMEINNEVYLTEWEKNNNDYDNPEIQRLSVERLRIVSRAFDKITETNVGIKETFKEYVSDVIEIDIFISNDLTTKGIESIYPTSNRAVNNGRDLRQALIDLQSAIEDARTEITQNGITMN